MISPSASFALPDAAPSPAADAAVSASASQASSDSTAARQAIDLTPPISRPAILTSPFRIVVFQPMVCCGHGDTTVHADPIPADWLESPPKPQLPTLRRI